MVRFPGQFSTVCGSFGGDAGGADAKTAALIDFCHLFFNATEFFYVD